MIDPARRARLLLWAHRSHPDHPGWGTHDYMGDCPWCRHDWRNDAGVLVAALYGETSDTT